MRTRLSALACLLLAVVALSAQDPSSREEQLPVFRTQADLVRVDMYATRNNTLVTDLRADEVEVYEDNVRQRIDTFELVRPGTALAGAPLEPVASDARSRVFVVFVDTYTTRLQNNGELRRSLVRFLDQLLGPTDLVGLMTPDMYASEVVLGRRHTVISDLANDERWSRPDARRPDQNEFAWENCYPRAGGQRAGGNPRGGGNGGGGGGGNSGSVPWVDAGDVARRFPVESSAVPPEDGVPSDGSPRPGGGGGGLGGGGLSGGGALGGSGGRLGDMRARYQGKATIEGLMDLVTHLGTLREERKAVLLVTGGWPFAVDASSGPVGQFETDRCARDRAALERTDFPALLRDLSKTANRANVSFYPVNSRQAGELPKGTSAVLRQQAQQREKRTLETIQGQLRALASETDGMAELKTTSLAAVTDRIISDTSAYYLIGYRSPNASRSDRRFHSITVKVNRPGLQIRSRPGYGGDVLVPRVVIASGTAPRAPVVDARLMTALTLVERFDARAPFWGRSSSWSGSPAASGAFWYVGELGLETRLLPTWGAGARAEVEVLAADRTRVMAQSIDLSPSNASFIVRVPAEGVLPSGDYSVRVRIKPASEQGQPVQDTLRVTLGGTASPLGEPVFWRRGPSARMTFFETADPRFRRTERLRLELPMPTKGETPTTRLLDRTGKPLQIGADVNERADASGEFRWLVIDVPIVSMAPGDYAIEVTGNETTRVTAFRVVP